jgi:hypothetical protein
MNLTEEQKFFIKEKIQSLLPSGRIYLFYSYGNNSAKSTMADLMIFAERELTLKEKENIRSSFWMLFGGSDFNIRSYKHGADTKEIKYELIEGIEL